MEGPPSQISGPQVTAPVTGVTRPGTGAVAPVTGVTRPGTETVLGKPGIDLFDDAETGIELDTTDPSNRQTIVDRAKSAGVGNVEQHITNNSKLARARDEGLISDEDYNILGGYDVTQNITAGSTFVGGALNMFGSPVYNVGQAIFDPETQKLGDIPGTVARNTVGGYGLLSQDQKNAYDAIINADEDSLYTDEGIAAVKNQIEMSKFRDPIMDMVQPDVGTLAGIGDLPDISDEFAMFDLPEPTPTPSTEEFDTADFGETTTGINPFEDVSLDDFDTTPPAGS